MVLPQTTTGAEAAGGGEGFSWYFGGGGSRGAAGGTAGGTAPGTGGGGAPGGGEDPDPQKIAKMLAFAAQKGKADRFGSTGMNANQHVVKDPKEWLDAHKPEGRKRSPGTFGQQVQEWTDWAAHNAAETQRNGEAATRPEEMVLPEEMEVEPPAPPGLGGGAAGGTAGDTAPCTGDTTPGTCAGATAPGTGDTTAPGTAGDTAPSTAPGPEILVEDVEDHVDPDTDDVGDCDIDPAIDTYLRIPWLQFA